MPSLVIRSRGVALRTLALTREPLTVGRADSCDVILRDDAEVSREHAHIWLDDDGHVIVADRNSKNGTRVDGGEAFRNAKRLAYRSVHIGEHEIEIVGAPPAAPPARGVEFEPDSPATFDHTQFFPSSRRLDLNQQRLALLMSLGEQISGAFDRKQLLEQALNACCDALGFERGMIVLKTPRGETEAPVTRNVQRDETGAYKISRTLVNRALLRGERAVVNNPATDLVNNLTESLIRFPICSALCVPIIHREEVLGVIYGDRVTRSAEFTPADVDFLAAIARQVGNGLANQRLAQEYARTQRVYAELERARELQQRLLPAERLARGRLVAAGYNAPSSAVGGDYFDYFDLGDGRVGLIIADVTGHGLPAALLMANLQAAMRVALTRSTPLPDLAARLNRLTCENTDSKTFITAIVGTVDAQSGTMEYVSAGHPSPVLFGAGAHELPEGDNSLPFGVQPDETFQVQRIETHGRFDSVLLYTDGLVEASDPLGRILTIDPVVHAIAGATPRTADGMIETALGVVQQHLAGGSASDDLTLLAMHLEG